MFYSYRLEYRILSVIAAALLCAIVIAIGGNNAMPTVLAAMTGISFLWAICFNPLIGLLLLQFLIFSKIVAGLEIPGGFFFVTCLVALGLFVNKVYQFDLSIHLPKKQSILIALFFSALVLSIPFSLNQEISTLKLLAYLKVVLLYLLMVNIIKTKKQFSMTIAVIVTALIFSFVYGLYNVFLALQGSEVGEAALRIRGLGIRPNYFAATLCVFLPIPFLFSFEEESPTKRFFWLALFALMVIAVVATLSRGGLLSLAFVMLLLIFKKRHSRTVIMGSMLTVLLILMILPPELWERFEQISFVRGETSLRWRSKLFLGATSYFVENPILGIGLGNFIEEAIRFIPKHQVAHNMYLEIAAETGIFGLLAFLGLLWVTLRYFEESGALFLNSDQTRFALLAEALKVGFYGFLFASLFLSLQADTLLWAQIGLAGALRVIAETSGQRGVI